MDLFSGTISNLEKGLSYATTKNKAIAQNIANVDTPNYKAVSVSFKEMLADAQSVNVGANRSDQRHYDFSMQAKNTSVFGYNNFKVRHNGNGVDMDSEQASLAENTIYYNALVERVNGKLSSLNTVIKGGR